MTKKIIILVAAILSFVRLSAQGWQNTTVGISDNFYGIDFSDNTTGWAVSYNQGRIYKSFNNGNSWTLHDSIPNSFLRDVLFIDSLTGFISGLDLLFNTGLLFKTIDGGNNWSRVSLPNNNSLLTDIRFINHLEGYVFGYHGAILHTTNGGNTWNLEPPASMSNSHIWDAELLGSDTLLLASDQFYRRISDTSSWNIVSQNIIYDIDFINQDTGFAIVTRTNHNDILKTVDGGGTWNIISSHQLGGSYAIPSINAISSQIIFIAGEYRQIYLSTDGGTSWNLDIQIDSNFHIHDLIEESNSIWAVGDSGQILKKQLVVSLKELGQKHLISVSPNPTNSILQIPKEENVKIIRLMALNGVVVKSYQKYIANIDVTDLKKGVYIIQIIYDDDQSSQVKFIKN